MRGKKEDEKQSGGTEKKAKEASERMRMMERDYRVLEALEKWGVLGLGQIDAAFHRRPEDAVERMRLYFNEIDRRDYWLGAYKRMELLRRLDLVRLERYINHHQTYLLTTAGHRLLYSRGRSMLGSFRQVMPEMFLDHELTVAAVGLILEETSGKKILSSRQLYETREPQPRRGRRDIMLPDLWIVDRDWPCAVEIELNQKSERRYRDLFEEYRTRLQRGGRVLYLTGWAGLRDTIIKLATQRRFPHLYAASIPDFRAARERCRFVAATGEVFQIVRDSAAAPALDAA